MMVRRKQLTYLVSILVEGLAGGLWVLLECQSSIGNLKMEGVML